RRDQIPLQIERLPSVLTNVPVKTRMWEKETVTHTFSRQHLVPTRQTFLTVFHILTTQHFIQRVSQSHFARFQLTIFDNRHRESFIGGEVVGVLLLFLVTTFQTRGKEISGIRTYLTAKQIERVTEPEIYVLLNDLERNAAELADVTFFHELRCTTTNAT